MSGFNEDLHALLVMGRARLLQGRARLSGTRTLEYEKKIAVTGATRTQILNQLLEIADLKSYDADSKDLGTPRMKNEKSCLNMGCST